MASSNTSSAPNASTTGFPGDEFANNLFSDLAPLLTLFGEQVTKQFLSLSVGWADNFMLAMAPLGILTVVVSSIRVTTDRYMKALVGRARESRAMAEAELLSSTSDEVCELFDGNQIVRVLGEPDTKEFVYRERSNSGGYGSEPMVWGLREAWEENELRFTEVDSGSSGKFATFLRWLKNALAPQALQALMGKGDRRIIAQNSRNKLLGSEQDLIEGLLLSAPNIILNVPEAVAPRWELWLFAWVGIISQVAVLILGALTTYHWKFEKGGAPIAQYGYPCTLAGTLTVTLGLLLCSHVIEGSTDECKLELRDTRRRRQRILRIQRACVVSEQHFSSYALFNSETSNFLRTSRLNKSRNYNILAAIGSLLAIAGFIVQFVGLRALHWSATIMQLGATIFMTAVRSYVRRGLAHDMEWEPIPEGEELGWFTEHVCHTQGLEVLSGAYVPYENRPFIDELEYASRDPIPSVLSYSLPPKISQKLTKEKQSQLEALAKANLRTLPEILQSPPFDGAFIAAEMIDQQSRLVDMSKWGEPQSEIAQQLISAMLQVRDIIEDPQNFQQRSNFGYSKRETIWSMPIVLHPDDSMEPGISQPLLRDISLKLVRVDIQGDDRDPTKRLRMTIGTLLSLWLRLINKRTRQLDWRLDSPSALQRVEGMEREMRMTPKSVFVRIVAFESTGDENERGKLELLARWLDTRIYRVPSPTGTTRLGRTGGVFGLESESPSSWEHLVYHHPVFGLPFSSFQSTHVYSDSNNDPFSKSDVDAIKRYYAEESMPWCLGWEKPGMETSDSYYPGHAQPGLPSTCPPGKIEQNKDFLRRKIHPEVAIHCEGSLIQNCALEIFSAFFMEATAGVDKVLGTTVFRRGIDLLPGNEIRDLGRDMWVNDVIDKIARVLFDCGFVDSQGEGRNIIVPVLSARDLLPTHETSRERQRGPMDKWLLQV